VLQHLVTALTAVELDPALASALSERFAGTNVTIVSGDATDLPFDDGQVSAALSFTMLHHVPTQAMQNQVFAELAGVVRPGGWIAGEDGLPSDELRDFHQGDTYVPVDPDTLVDRLRSAGWNHVEVTTNEYAIRFRGTAPA
jgi:SAM-dependent methyltransferase